MSSVYQTSASLMGGPSSSQMRAVVKYGYEAEDGNQLSLRVGDVLLIHSQDSEDWWDAEFEGNRGYIPAKYVELMNYTIPQYNAGSGSGMNSSDSMDTDNGADASHSSDAALLSSSSFTAAQLELDKRRRAAQVLLAQSNPTDSAALYLTPSASSASFAAPLLGADFSAQDHHPHHHHHHAQTNPQNAFWTASDSGATGNSSLGSGEFLSDSHASSSNGGSAAGASFFTPKNKNIFSLWSSSLGKLSGLTGIVVGMLTLIMGLYNRGYFKDIYIYVGVYSVIIGGLTIVYEVFWGRTGRTAIRLPVRSVCYGALAVPQFLCYPTRVSGTLYGIVALINLIATIRGESVVTRPRRLGPSAEEEMDLEYETPHGTAAGSSSSSATFMNENSGGSMPIDPSKQSIFPAIFATFFLDKSVPHRGRRWMLLLCLVFWNMLSVTYLALIYEYDISGGDSDVKISDGWNKWHYCGRATVFLLLMNLILFFFTCMRFFSRRIYDLAELSRVSFTKTFYNQMCARILTFFPPDPHHAIQFYHNLLALLIIFISILHGLSHTLSYMIQPEETLMYYNRWVMMSGAILIVLSLLIFSVSKIEIRRGSLQLFRLVHYLYIPFFIILLFHCNNGSYSKISAVVIAIPLTFFIVDSLYNYCTKRRLPLPVLSVSFVRPNSLRVEVSTRMSPALQGVFKEGSWAYINFPALDNHWQPVMVSSPPQAVPVSQTSGGSSHPYQARALQQRKQRGSNAGGRGAEREQDVMLADMHGRSDDISSPSFDNSSFSSDTPEGGTAFTFHLYIEAARIGSRSSRVAEYLESFGPLGSNHFLLDEPGHHHTVNQGRLWDTKGKRLIRIDGPHYSPVVHATKYHCVLLVTPTAGLNALAATMRSVLQHRWKSSVAVGGGMGDGRSSSLAASPSSPNSMSFSARDSRLLLGAGPGRLFTTPDVLFMVWVLKWHEIDETRWFLQELKECEDALFALRDSSASAGGAASGGVNHLLLHKHFEFHFFVEGVPNDTVVGGHGMSPQVHEADFFGPSSSTANAAGPGKAPLTCLQLYRALKNPTAAVQRFSCTHVHRGSPHFGELFASVNHRATGQSDVACIYTCGPLSSHITNCSASCLKECGFTEVPSGSTIMQNKKISEQLKSNCKHYSALSGKTWRYHTDVDVL